MPGIRMSIYVKDAEIIESLKVAAKADGRSVSSYLIHMHTEAISFGKIFKCKSCGRAHDSLMSAHKCCNLWEE